jgi:hypothetical protein
VAPQDLTRTPASQSGASQDNSASCGPAARLHSAKWTSAVGEERKNPRHSLSCERVAGVPEVTVAYTFIGSMTQSLVVKALFTPHHENGGRSSGIAQRFLRSTAHGE